MNMMRVDLGGENEGEPDLGSGWQLKDDGWPHFGYTIAARLDYMKHLEDIILQELNISANLGESIRISLTEGFINY